MFKVIKDEEYKSKVMALLDSGLTFKKAISRVLFETKFELVLLEIDIKNLDDSFNAETNKEKLSTLKTNYSEAISKRDKLKNVIEDLKNEYKKYLIETLSQKNKK